MCFDMKVQTLNSCCVFLQACLHCSYVACGRYILEHAFDHYKQTKVSFLLFFQFTPRPSSHRTQKQICTQMLLAICVNTLICNSVPLRGASCVNGAKASFLATRLKAHRTCGVTYVSCLLELLLSISRKTSAPTHQDIVKSSAPVM